MSATCEKPVSNHFPPRMREALIEASMLPTLAERIEQIDIVCEWARAVWPEMFKREGA